MRRMVKKIFTYDDICLRPKYSELRSREDADTNTKFLGRTLPIPVIPANMEDVIDCNIALDLASQGYGYIFHRFSNQTPHFLSWFHERFREKASNCLCSISLGVNDDSKAYLESLIQYSSDWLHWVTVDVAHGHHKKTKDMINYIRGCTNAMVIAGNVATADGYKYLCDAGASAVKVGIGGGSICTTRYQTGFHLPTAYSIWECAQVGWDIPIIADGGAKHYGDVAKALVLGADVVMNGGWFASCIDSPARILNGKKIYRGSTSYESKKQRKHIEGKTLELDEGITYKERLEEIRQAICSSISYAGGKDLSAFNQVKWEIL